MKGSVTRMRSSLPGKARGFRGAGRTPLNALPAWERETEAAGVMEGPGESSPRSGVRRGGAPRQPQCITLGRLAPRHFAVRRRPRCPPPLARRGGVPCERGAGGGIYLQVIG